MDAVSHNVRKPSFLLLLLALTLVRGILYGMMIPPWQAPDEPQHYQMVRLIMDLKRTPSAGDVQLAVGLSYDVAQSLRDNRFWELRHRRPAPDSQDTTVSELLDEEKLDAAVDHPPLYYALASLVLIPLRSSSILTHLYVLRALSVLMSLVTVWAVYTVAVWLSPLNRTRAWAAGCLVVFLPMHSFMSGALNNDALAQMLSALAIVLLALICLGGLSPARVGVLILVLFLALFTKRTTLFLIPLVLVILIYLMARSRRSSSKKQARCCHSERSEEPHGASNDEPLRQAHGDLRQAFGVSSVERSGDSSRLLFLGTRTLLILVAIVILILALILFYESSAGHWWDIPAQMGYMFESEHFTGAALGQYAEFALLGFASFWANFGWLTVPLDVGWYVLLAVLSLVAFLGGLRGAWRVWHDTPGDTSRRFVWVVLGLAVLLVIAQSVVSMLSRQRPPQGRYLFPALVPISLCFTWGVFEWVPRRYHRVSVGLWLLWWVALDLIGVIGYVLPYFYG